MMKTPPVESYTNDDFLNYRKLVQQTNVTTYPRNVIQGQSRPKTAYKWRIILVPLQQQEAGVTDEDAHDEQSGEGIQFLPGEIKGLTMKLNLLLAEFADGNTSPTRNDIVYILDALLKQKQIPRAEY